MSRDFYKNGNMHKNILALNGVYGNLPVGLYYTKYNKKKLRKKLSQIKRDIL